MQHHGINVYLVASMAFIETLIGLCVCSFHINCGPIIDTFPFIGILLVWTTVLLWSRCEGHIYPYRISCLDHGCSSCGHQFLVLPLAVIVGIMLGAQRRVEVLTS